MEIKCQFQAIPKTSTISKKVFRMGFKKAPLQKSYQLAVGAQSYSLEFTAANRQFGWLEISLVYDKSL